MSQILDALRRAEAQRSRGRVPGLHETSGQVTLTPGQADAPGSRRPLVIGVAVLMTLAVIGVLLLLLRPHPGPRVELGATTPSDATAGSPANATTPAAPMVAAPVIGLPRKAQLPATSAASPAQVPAQSPVLTPDDRSPSREPPAGILADKPPPALTTDPPLRPVAPADSIRSANVPASGLPARQDLPPEFQRSLPPITVSGTVYSSDPAQRMLVVNGELWHEGDQIRPGLVLEQIRRRDAVLRYNGVRFTVGP